MKECGRKPFDSKSLESSYHSYYFFSILPKRQWQECNLKIVVVSSNGLFSNVQGEHRSLLFLKFTYTRKLPGV